MNVLFEVGATPEHLTRLSRQIRTREMGCCWIYRKKEAKCGSLRSVPGSNTMFQNGLNSLSKFGWGEGFTDEVPASLHFEGQIVISRHQEPLRLGACIPDFHREVRAIHLSGHNNVGHQKMNRSRVFS